MELDLASLKSIRHFAVEVIKDFPQIHVLINNAGVAVPPLRECKTKDGFEVNMGVNHIGHFYLTKLLLQKLKDSAPSRYNNIYDYNMRFHRCLYAYYD